MVISDMAKVRELKIVEADGEFLGDELPDKGVDHAKALTRTGGADDASEWTLPVENYRPKNIYIKVG